jgi:hypothetical protein
MSTPTAARSPIRRTRPPDQDPTGGEVGRWFSMTEA